MTTISERIVSKKRHTTGFIIGGESYTRAQAIKLARRGEIDGVRVAKGPQGPYIVSSTETSLYSLPTRVEEKRRRGRPATSAAKTTKTTPRTRTRTNAKTAK